MTPRVAVLTGAASGIGEATALRLAEAGYRLVLLGRSTDALADLAARVGGADVHHLDLAETEHVVAVGEALAAEHGHVAALVNCAGAMLNRRMGNVEVHQMYRLLSVNAVAPYFLAQRLLPSLRAAGGSVVNVVSVSALHGVAAQSAYSASKGALVALTRSMAAEWGPLGVRVNGVAPGVTRTPMSAPAYRNGGYRSYVEERIPLGRWGAPEDAASAIAYLCSSGARYVTGEILTVDGGLGGLYWLSVPAGGGAGAIE